jgi:spore maturation protein CgeB
LVRELSRLGHEVWFLERDVPWYGVRRDDPVPDGVHLVLYRSLVELRRSCESLVRESDGVIVGSYLPEGATVCDWVLEKARGVTAFYDIDTPVTLAKLARNEAEYLAPHSIAGFDLYLSFTGGPILRRLEREHGARRAVHLPCFADPERYRPLPTVPIWTLGYFGSYSCDRQPVLDRLLLEPARLRPQERFVVAGTQYPANVKWPANVDRIEHLAPHEHAAFYCAQRFTLNLMRRDLVEAGWSPNERLFEAAACGVPIVSDVWSGISEYFQPGEEIIIASSHLELERFSEKERISIGARGRARVVAQHTARHRAEQLESLLAHA